MQCNCLANLCPFLRRQGLMETDQCRLVGMCWWPAATGARQGKAEAVLNVGSHLGAATRDNANCPAS